MCECRAGTSASPLRWVYLEVRCPGVSWADQSVGRCRQGWQRHAAPRDSTPPELPCPSCLTGNAGHGSSAPRTWHGVWPQAKQHGCSSQPTWWRRGSCVQNQEGGERGRGAAQGQGGSPTLGSSGTGSRGCLSCMPKPLGLIHGERPLEAEWGEAGAGATGG